MSVGVLDVGCFSAHLVVVERDLLRPLVSHKVRLRLDRELDARGAISGAGVDSVCAAVLAARKKAGDVPFLPFATSSVRDSTNSAEVIRKVARRTGVELKVLSGKEEARLSYAAARHWFGWSAGSMVVLDVGGGTVELAAGSEAEPERAVSLPLGARTLTRTGLTGWRPRSPGARAIVPSGARRCSNSWPASPARAAAPTNRASCGSRTWRSGFRASRSCPCANGRSCRGSRATGPSSRWRARWSRRD
jgi:exopolyphosphatase/pppGpp-phosphohydrolase